MTVGAIESRLTEIEERLAEIERRATRVDALADIARLNAIKITTLTEVSWFSRKANANNLTASGNLILAMDLSEEWWDARKSWSLGQWWGCLNVSGTDFRRAYLPDAD